MFVKRGQALRVLVIGGAGYIGAHICKALAQRGDEPIVFDNLSSGHEHAVKWGPIVRGDLRNIADLQRAFAEYEPQAVMHFAAKIEVGEGQKYPLEFWDNNVAGVITLLKMMASFEVEPLVFSSTCAVYGDPETIPIHERETRTPVSVYGRTKNTVESMLEDVSSASSLRYAALRYFNACGASPEGEIGEEHDPETHLIPNALKAAAGKGGDMKLFGDDYPTPDGTCVRDYIHVSDLARAHLLALDRLISGAESFACNLGTGTGLSVKEILDSVERVVGRPVPHTIEPRRPGDAERLVSDTRLAKSLLGFEPEHSAPDEIIKDAWNFHKSRF